MRNNLLQFEDHIRSCAAQANADWGFSESIDEFVRSLKARIPSGVLETIGAGIANEIVLPVGRKFTLRGLLPKKGPYNWFCPHQDNKTITPNWEYYIQIAEYVRFARAFDRSDNRLNFEDSFMDIAVYENDKLLVCCEVKEKVKQANALLSGVQKLQTGVDMESPIAGNDALSKARYIVRHRPSYFCLTAIGARHEFSVSYPAENAFELMPDIVPCV